MPKSIEKHMLFFYHKIEENVKFPAK